MVRYKSTKIYDKTSFTLNYILQSLFDKQGIHMTKVQAIHLAVVEFGKAIERMQEDKKKNEADARCR